jgi:hypothetical protein
MGLVAARGGQKGSVVDRICRTKYNAGDFWQEPSKNAPVPPGTVRRIKDEE